MKILQKLAVLTGLLSLLSAIPMMAQIPQRVTFETSFAFYAGNARMPAGSYTVTQPDSMDNVLLIESSDGSHSAFLECEAITPQEPSRKDPSRRTEVTFKKYGTTEFLNRVSVKGEDIQFKVSPTKAERNAAKAGAAEEHSLVAKNGN
jgi:hypothetical protein